MSQSIQQAKLNNPKVTVIIPVYNAEKYLEECLDSVVSQDLNEIEILCIDDGSTDSSGKILDEYKTKDYRLSAIHKKNEGVAKTRNIGIRIAQGKYVIFMDPDDYYPSSDILKTLCTTAEENGVKITGTEFSHITPEGVVEYGDIYNNELLYGYNFKKEGLVSFKDYQFDYGFHRFLFLKSFLLDNNIFFPELIRFQDPPFLVDALAQAGVFYAIKKIGYRYRLRSGGVQWNTQKVSDLIKGIMYIHDFAKENNYDKLKELMQRRMTTEYGNIVEKELIRSVDFEKQISSSISYKLGLLLTFLPRKMVHFMRGDL